MLPVRCTNSNVSEHSFIYKKWKRVYESIGGKVLVADSAVHAGADNCLVKSAQTVPMSNHLASIRARAATSVRQSAEWGNAASDILP